MMGKRSVVVLRTHFWDAHVQRLFNKLTADLGADRVYCIFDATHASPATLSMLGSVAWSRSLDLSQSPARVVTMTEADCGSINAMHFVGKPGEVGSKYRGETHNVAMYRALRSRPDWDYMWVMEYDVHCQGSFAKPLQACDSIHADFMAKGCDTGFEVRTGRNDPGWCWWPDRYGPDLSRVPVADLHGCFYPLTRYSRAFLDVLDADLGRNSGFCEVYIPTLCVLSSLTYRPMPAEVFGTFRFFNPMHPLEFAGKPADDRLYHPVKPF